MRTAVGRSDRSLHACTDRDSSWCISRRVSSAPSHSACFGCLLSLFIITRSPSSPHGHSSKATAPAFPHQNEAYRTCVKPEAYPRWLLPPPKAPLPAGASRGNCGYFSSMGEVTSSFRHSGWLCLCLPEESRPHRLAGVSLSLVF